jgi:hypothetical protein
MRRPIETLALALAAFALLGAVAAAKLQSPKTGPWVTQSDGSGGGFTIKKAGKKLLLANYHLLTGEYSGCPEKPTKVSVVGKYPLKVFSRGGYSTYGVGKNQGGDVVPMKAKVRAEGKVQTGSFYVVWDYAKIRTDVIGGSISFGGCETQLLFAHPK